LANEGIDDLAHTCVREVLTIGRAGVYVDAGEDDGAEPYITIYVGENILNWRYDTIDGRRKLTIVVLQEIYEESVDGFQLKRFRRYRVLRLGGEEGNEAAGLTYFVETYIHERGDDGNELEDSFVSEGQVVPTMRGGATLDHIPFSFVSVGGTASEVSSPPLLDLCNVILSDYRNSADLEHGLHFAALPTPYVIGDDSDDKPVRKIGSSTAWEISNDRAQVGYLEFSGKGLGAISDMRADKRKQMAVLGARMLEEQKRASEAAETLRLRQSGEQSALANVSMACSQVMTLALQWHYMWTNPGHTLADPRVQAISYDLNKDFAIGTIDAQTINALFMLLQSGAVSWDTFFYNLSQGEIIPAGVTSDEERALIASAGLPGGSEELPFNDAPDTKPDESKDN